LARMSRHRLSLSGLPSSVRAARKASMYGVARASPFRNPVASATCADHVSCSYWGMNFPQIFQRRISKQLRISSWTSCRSLAKGHGSTHSPFSRSYMCADVGRVGKASHSSWERKRTHLSQKPAGRSTRLPSSRMMATISSHVPPLRRDTG